MTKIPPNAADVVPPSNGPENGRREDFEFELLEAERALRKLLTREAGQRYWLRWIAVGAGCLVIVGMASLLWHLAHIVFWGPFVLVGPAFSVAMLVTPILSITTITVALFVGAFRKFEDKDIDTMSSGIAGAASFMRGS
ncbi:hypothetical protein T8A63_07375 [Sulfitobacter sp. OXR-159]|uniref:hypothetical protein n=1 Tax=Sulfitobacter sp. OXR-159 TaxID=3100174 RepID=UPI002AC9666D|nr:hypothetical protein [Sulfitobacter sp. OXR-159]WPZ30776.1 hypothetical protein T8A63_06865 [Sulfitobacter sp. OXR-159]WPZ30877.1 hypothetical protein T8A63_07375 [Sulfitobacter sp. OXR-159]